MHDNPAPPRAGGERSPTRAGEPRRWHRRLWWGLVGLAWLAPTAASAAPGAPAAHAASETRPQVGLVLSGGGALGAAHVGVIKVIEELGIPIDVVAGTSMGSIVGSLYATGRNADELEQLLLATDWASIFNDEPVRADLSFRRKQDERDGVVDFELGVTGTGITLPAGLIEGQRLDNQLRALLLGPDGDTTFDDTVIPFRAVATDIETGEPVVLSTGDLASAVRASMAVPGVFPPVAVDGKLLVDGGLANNTPVDVARSMGADIVIVVDLGVDLRPKEELGNSLALIDQTLKILTRQNMLEQLASLGEDDILIQPELGSITPAAFARVAEVADIGEDAARARRDTLLALRERVGPATQQAREIAVGPPRHVEFVELDNRSRVPDARIRSLIELAPGDELDLEALQRNLDRVYGIGLVRQVTFDVVERERQTGVIIRVEPRAARRNTLRFGIQFESNLDADVSVNARAEVTMRNLTPRNGELKTVLQVGDRPRLFTEFYQPIDARARFFVAPSILFSQRRRNLFQDGDLVANYKIAESGVRLDVGRVFANTMELRAGVGRAFANADLRVGDDRFPDEEIDSADVQLAWTVDTADDLNFPTRGVRLTALGRRSLEALGAEEDFTQIDIGYTVAGSLGHSTLVQFSRAGITTSGDPTLDALFSLGGLFNLSAFGVDELTDENRLLTGLAWYQGVPALSRRIAGIPAYVGLSLEAGNVYSSPGEIELAELRWSTTAFVGLDTFIGPVYLAGARGEGGRGAAFVLVGNRF